MSREIERNRKLIAHHNLDSSCNPSDCAFADSLCRSLPKALCNVLSPHCLAIVAWSGYPRGWKKNAVLQRSIGTYLLSKTVRIILHKDDDSDASVDRCLLELYNGIIWPLILYPVAASSKDITEQAGTTLGRERRPKRGAALLAFMLLHPQHSFGDRIE